MDRDDDIGVEGDGEYDGEEACMGFQPAYDNDDDDEEDGLW